MHLVENYALTAGLRISKPFVDPLFFPTPSIKYITMHCGSGMKSKNYSHYQDVVDILLPKLKDEGIDIIQIGEAEDPELKGVISLLGKTSLRQTFYVISKSMLQLGNDSFSAHIAGFFKVPLVTLFGPTWPNSCEAYWKKELVKFSPDYTLYKPSYSPNEREKRIDKIFPDKIASATLNLLFKDKTYPEIQEVHLGESYDQKILDVVPDFIPDSIDSISKSSILSIRQDYTKEDKYLDFWLSQFPSALYINRPIDLNLLKKHKNKIKKIIIFLNDDISYYKIMQYRSTGINTAITYTGSKNISDIRVDLFGLNIYSEEFSTKKDLDNIDYICDNSYFKSSLTVMSKNKKYPCKHFLDMGIEVSDKQTILDHEDFYKELEFYKIYNYDTKH